MTIPFIDLQAQRLRLGGAIEAAVQAAVVGGAWVMGPQFETPAEIRMLRGLGADAVGMSTVPEVIVAKHMELPVFAISVITDMGYPEENIKETSLEDVIRVASEAEPKLTTVLRELIESM